MYQVLSRLNANEQKQIPRETWYTFDEKPAVVEFWFAWSPQAIPEFESLTRWINEQDRGSVKDPAERARLRQLIAGMASATPSRGKAGSEETIHSAAARF